VCVQRRMAAQGSGYSRCRSPNLEIMIFLSILIILPILLSVVARCSCFTSVERPGHLENTPVIIGQIAGVGGKTIKTIKMIMSRARLPSHDGKPPLRRYEATAELLKAEPCPSVLKRNATTPVTTANLLRSFGPMNTIN